MASSAGDGTNTVALAAAFERVFAVPMDPDAPFRRELETRTLLYPIDYTNLDQDQYAALLAASLAAGDTPTCAVAEVEDGRLVLASVVIRSLVDYRVYRDGDPAIEHVLFSPNGAWGIMTTDAEIAVVAGTERFVQTLESALPSSVAERASTFVRDQRALADIGAFVGWVPRLLNGVLGASATRALIGDDWPDAPEDVDS